MNALYWLGTNKSMRLYCACVYAIQYIHTDHLCSGTREKQAKQVLKNIYAHIPLCLSPTLYINTDVYIKYTILCYIRFRMRYGDLLSATAIQVYVITNTLVVVCAAM